MAVPEASPLRAIDGEGQALEGLSIGSIVGHLDEVVIVYRYDIGENQ
jgi:hypothetical protein